MERELLTKIFFSDNERYADLLNGCICGGAQIVSAEDLQEMDTQTGIHALRSIQKKNVPRYIRKGCRDLVRRLAFGMNFAVIGVENQEELDYALPLRILSYDVSEYETQAAQIRRAVRKNKKRHSLSPGEYLYGFAKDSRLHPTITLVLYYGTKEWDASRDLHGMMDFSDIPPAFQKLVQEHPEYRDMDEDAFDMLAEYTKDENLISVKDDNCSEGRVNMCEAITALMQKSRDEGRSEGLSTGLMEGEKKGEDTFAALADCLMKENRLGDLQRAINDKNYRKKLYKKFRL